MQHFQRLLTEPNISREENINKITQHILNLVSRDQNMALLREISKADVEEIIKNMVKNKAPGPDGYTVEFVQATWSFMGEDIVKIVEESRRTKRMHPVLNSTFLALISKTNHSEELQGFRPIALRNVIYKIMTIIMVNRLNPILLGLISQEQTGFVKGRQIIDGIVMAQEAIHSLKTKNRRYDG